MTKRLKPYDQAQLIPLPQEYDARRRLTNDQKDAIRQNPLGLSVRALSEQYHVSKRTVQFILYPERLERMKEATKKRVDAAGGWGAYLAKYGMTEAVKKWRRKKYKLFKEGKIG